MDTSSLTSIGLFVFAALFGIIGYLLAKKDEAQGQQIAQNKEEVEKKLIQLEAEIKLLFKKHDEDVAHLNELRVKIAENHPDKADFEKKFQEFTQAFREIGNKLEGKFDELQKTLLTHVMDHHRKGDPQ